MMWSDGDDREVGIDHNSQRDKTHSTQETSLAAFFKIDFYRVFKNEKLLLLKTFAYIIVKWILYIKSNWRSSFLIDKHFTKLKHKIFILKHIILKLNKYTWTTWSPNSRGSFLSLRISTSNISTRLNVGFKISSN